MRQRIKLTRTEVREITLDTLRPLSHDTLTELVNDLGLRVLPVVDQQIETGDWQVEVRALPVEELATAIAEAAPDQVQTNRKARAKARARAKAKKPPTRRRK